MAVDIEAFENSDEERIKGEVLKYFFERQAAEPGFFATIMQTLQNDYDSTSSVERDVIAAAQRFIHPDDVAERARSTAAFLLTRYILSDIETYTKIEQSFLETLANNTAAPDSPTT